MKGYEATVRLLLENATNIEPSDVMGEKPVLLAADNGHEAVVRLLL
jgi:ankyrin repeat protein